MRVIFAPGAYARGHDLLRQMGRCRACGKVNVAWIVRGHIVTMSTLACEYCGSHEGGKRKGKASETGIQWRSGSDCWHGRVMCRNYPELAKSGDLII